MSDLAQSPMQARSFLPSFGGVDAGTKLADYFALASVQHSVIVRTADRVIQHSPAPDGGILTRIVRDHIIA